MPDHTSERKQIAIIGAGITGLSAAYHLQKAGHSAIIFEQSSRIGGAIESSLENGFLCEHGPNSMMVNDKRIDNFIADIDLEDAVIATNGDANKRFVIHNGKLKALPHSIMSFLGCRLFSIKAKLRLAWEPFVAKKHIDNESFASFVTRRLGPEMLEKAAGPFVNGIYAGDPSKLSTHHAFPKLFAMEQESGSLFRGLLKRARDRKKAKGDDNQLDKRKIISFKQGMETLPNAIAAQLEVGSIFPESSLESIIYKKKTKRWHIEWKGKNGTIGQGSFNDIIITVPAHAVGTLPLEKKVLSTVCNLSKIEYPPVTALMLAFKRNQVQHPLDGFGMLNSLNEKSKILGALFTSTVFDGRAPKDSVTIHAMLGGSRAAKHAELSDENMVKEVLDELSRLLDITGNPVYSKIVRWKKAIPQINIGYSDILKQIITCENSFPGIHFGGNYRGGISVGDCIINGINLSDTISSEPDNIIKN